MPTEDWKLQTAYFFPKVLPHKATNEAFKRTLGFFY
jgi:hypothetical protein